MHRRGSHNIHVLLTMKASTAATANRFTA